MLRKLSKKEEGFTIIEVLIVLAIAGLIMLVVFLAVPALQRNSRNTQRNSDASQIASAVNECLSNKNGVTGSCDQINATEVPINYERLSQLRNAGDSNNITFCGGVPGGTACGTFTQQLGTNPWANTVNVRFGDKCTPDGSNRTAGTARQYAVLYQTENAQGNGVTRCIDS
jgi:prepilin-type N-terminal cleavage/methylation domain-containing protein